MHWMFYCSSYYVCNSQIFSPPFEGDDISFIFYDPETGNASGTNKVVQAQK